MENNEQNKKQAVSLWRRLAAWFRRFLLFLFNPRLLLCFGIAWLITNGWSYIAFGIGYFADLPWLTAIATAYLTFLWIPFTPEKIVTVIIAIWLLTKLFPNDEKTLAVLREDLQKAKSAFKKIKK